MIGLEPPPQIKDFNWVWRKWFSGLYNGLIARIWPNGTDYGWTDYLASITAGRAVGANAPTWAVFRNGIEGYSFDAGTMNEIWLSFHINHDYKIGTALYPHIHWSPNTTSTGVVRWGFEYTVAKGHQQSVFGASTTIYVEQTIGSANQYGHYIGEVADGDAIDSAETEVDSLVLMRVFRDAAHANDTFPDDVWAWFVDMHVQIDRVCTKNKSPDFYS